MLTSANSSPIARYLQKKMVEKSAFLELLEKVNVSMARLEDGERTIRVQKLLGISKIWRDDDGPRIVIVEDVSGNQFVIPEISNNHPKTVSCCFLVMKGQQLKIELGGGKVVAAYFAD